MAGRKDLPFLLLIPLLLVAGCATGPSYRLHPQAQGKMRQIDTLVLPTPEVKLSLISAGGVVEQRDDWSEQAGEVMRRGVEKVVGRKGVKLLPPAAKEQQEGEIREVFDLFGVVGGAVLAHSYGTVAPFPGKKENFDYSVGTLQRSLSAGGGDGLILVQGGGSVSSGGRIAVAVVGALMGMGVPTGGKILQAALVDAQGTLLWYNYLVSSSASDLLDAAKVEGVVEELFQGFPEVQP